jgi:hypothetical protein
MIKTLLISLISLSSLSQEQIIMEFASSSNDTIIITYFQNPVDSQFYELTFIQSFILNSENNYSSIEMKHWLMTNLVQESCFVNGWIVYIETVDQKIFSSMFLHHENKFDYKINFNYRIYSLIATSQNEIIYDNLELILLKPHSKSKHVTKSFR